MVLAERTRSGYFERSEVLDLKFASGLNWKVDFLRRRLTHLNGEENLSRFNRGRSSVGSSIFEPISRETGRSQHATLESLGADGNVHKGRRVEKKHFLDLLFRTMAEEHEVDRKVFKVKRSTYEGETTQWKTYPTKYPDVELVRQTIRPRKPSSPRQVFWRLDGYSDDWLHSRRK